MENKLPNVVSDKQIMFLCTGNYYRSRTAEIIFNHEKERFQLSWHALSGGLARTFNPSNVGPISPFAKAYLSMVKMTDKTMLRHPILVQEADLVDQDLIVALSENEHRPMIEAFFPEMADRVHYLEIGDLPLLSPEEALPQIHQAVTLLCRRLADTDLDQDLAMDRLFT